MQSTWFSLGRATAAQLKALAASKGSDWLDNPPLPLDLPKGSTKAIFLLMRGDVLLDQPGVEQERRTLRLVVGAVSLSPKALEEADALHYAARDTLKSRSFRAALLAAGGAHDVREVEIEPQLRDMASPGSMLMSAYEIQYYQTYPSFAL